MEIFLKEKKRRTDPVLRRRGEGRIAEERKKKAVREASEEKKSTGEEEIPSLRKREVRAALKERRKGLTQRGVISGNKI